MTNFGIKNPQIDYAMYELVTAIEIAESFPDIVQALIGTMGDKEKLERSLYNLASAEALVFNHITEKKQTLVQLLIEGGKDD